MEIDLRPRDPCPRTCPRGPRIVRQAAVEMVARRLRRSVPRIPSRVPPPHAASEAVVFHDRDVLPRRPHHAGLPADSGAVLVDRNPAGGDVSQRIFAAGVAARHLRHRHLPFRAAVALRSGSRARLALARDAAEDRLLERLSSRTVARHPRHPGAVHPDGEVAAGGQFLAAGGRSARNNYCVTGHSDRRLRPQVLSDVRGGRADHDGSGGGHGRISDDQRRIHERPLYAAWKDSAR